MGLAEALLTPEPLPTPEGGGGSLDGCASNSKRSLEASASISPGKRMRGGVALPSTPSSSAAAMGESQGSSLEHSLPRIDSVVFRMADSLFKLFDMMVHLDLQSPDEIWQRAAAADAADAEGAAAETAVAVGVSDDSDEASDDGRFSDWGIADDSDEAMAGIGLDGSVDAMADVSGLGAGHADEHVAERAAERAAKHATAAQVAAAHDDGMADLGGLGAVDVVVVDGDTQGVSLASVFGGSRADPLPWELAAYALLLIEQTPTLHSGTERTRQSLLADLLLDVDAILSTGPSSSNTQLRRQLRGQTHLGLALQVLRRLAGQAPFGWSLRDVSFSPANFYTFFEMSKYNKRQCFLTDKFQLRWRAHADAAKRMLLDHPHGGLLLSTLGAARAELTAAHGGRIVGRASPTAALAGSSATMPPPPRRLRSRRLAQVAARSRRCPTRCAALRPGDCTPSSVSSQPW